MFHTRLGTLVGAVTHRNTVALRTGSRRSCFALAQSCAAAASGGKVCSVHRNWTVTCSLYETTHHLMTGKKGHLKHFYEPAVPRVSRRWHQTSTYVRILCSMKDFFVASGFEIKITLSDFSRWTYTKFTPNLSKMFYNCMFNFSFIIKTLMAQMQGPLLLLKSDDTNLPLSCFCPF